MDEMKKLKSYSACTSLMALSLLQSQEGKMRERDEYPGAAPAQVFHPEERVGEGEDSSVESYTSTASVYRTLSILVPVYNEEYYIEQILEEVLSASLPEGMDREVIVVDDASTDGTREMLREFAARHRQVQVFSHEKNQGKGAAIRTAVSKATGEVIVIQDADLEYNPQEYEKLLAPILRGEADAVYGSRFLASPYRRVLYFWHSLGNRFLTMLSNCFTDLNLTDMETCYKMVRASILKTMPLRSNRFGIEPELTAKLAKRGCRIYEVPISYRGRTYEEGKKITWRDGLKALFTILYFAVVDDMYDEQYGYDILHSLSKTQRINRWLADTIDPWMGENVLEIGAGMGNLSLQLLPRRAYTVSDIAPLYLDYLQQLFSHNKRVSVRKIDVEDPKDFEGLDGRFDTVVCLNVVEHVEKDDVALRNIYSALRPGGRVCVLVPRGPWLFGSLDRGLGHCRRYTEAGLKEKMATAGFQVEQQFTFNRVTVPAWFVNGKIFRKKRFNKLQLKLFDSTVWMWRRIDRLFPWPGLSLIAIGHKPRSAA
jgi:glycosyltransferase involved in cell wall biosynthesis